MGKLKLYTWSDPIEKIEKALKESTIFDKIEFSNISKETIIEKIKDLRERQVPNRTVFLDKPDEEIIEYWFKNWLHPSLDHCVQMSSRSKVGCSQKVILNDIKRDNLNFYENGQQNFNYTLKDMEEWCNE